MSPSLTNLNIWWYVENLTKHMLLIITSYARFMRLFRLFSTTVVLWKLAPSLQCFSCKWVSFSFFLDNGASQLVSDFALGCLWLLMSTRNQIWGRPGESLPGTKTRKNTEASLVALCGFHQNLSPNISHFLVVTTQNALLASPTVWSISAENWMF